MLNQEYVYVITDCEGKIEKVFCKRENAVNSLPDSIKFSPKEVHPDVWEYGEYSNKKTVKLFKVIDADGISL